MAKSRIEKQENPRNIAIFPPVAAKKLPKSRIKYSFPIS